MCRVFCLKSSIYLIHPEQCQELQPLQVTPCGLLLLEIHRVPNHPGKANSMLMHNLNDSKKKKSAAIAETCRDNGFSKNLIRQDKWHTLGNIIPPLPFCEVMTRTSNSSLTEPSAQLLYLYGMHLQFQKHQV
uniref:Diphosphoinositol polyphosphate phosphohydrolase n=2 Tax=Rhizophora mucronata TaxID=61149 RepID=A0A2P2MPH0_RHIMU